MRWQFGKGGRVVSREAGMEFKTKLCCIAPEKRNASRDSLQGFHKSYIMFWMLILIRLWWPNGYISDSR